MDYRYGIMGLVFIGSILSVVESNFREDRKYLFWKWSFYFSSYVFILSFLKYYLGYHKENLIESFWNAQGVTLVHYAVPLMIIAVILPLFLKFLFRDNCLQVIRYFDSTLCFMLCFTFFFVRKLNNRTYCTAFMLALAVSVIAIILRRTKTAYIADMGWGGVRQKIMEMLPVFLCYLITVVIYTPNELYLNNPADFPMSYWYFFWKLLLSGVLVTVVLMVSMLVYLNPKQLKAGLVFMFCLMTVGYVQGLFLNGSMGILDGTWNNAFSSRKIWINLVMWVVLVLLMLLFSWRKPVVFQKLMKVVSIWIVLIQVVTLGVMMITSEGTEPKSEMVLTTDGMLEVGEKDNIIVFVLDKYDGRYVDKILKEDATFFEPLRDFVFYENCASAFCPTYDSIPFLLTGAEFDEECHVDYVQYAYEGENLLRDIDNTGGGHNIGVYTEKAYVAESMRDIVSNYKAGVQRTCSMSNLFSLMVQSSMYKMAPFVAKEYYVYDTSDVVQLVVNDKIANVENDLPFYHRLVEDGLKVSDQYQNGVFRFIHMHGGHPPYTMTEDFQYVSYDVRRDDGWGSDVSQWKGAMKIVYEYMRQLKELGKYEDAFIIITSDHGVTASFSDANGNMTEISYPILYVKRPYEEHAHMITSNAPVCHADIIASIRKEIGLDISDRALDEIEAGEERTRYMYNSTPEILEKYEINGDIAAIENWKFLYSRTKELESTRTR